MKWTYVTVSNDGNEFFVPDDDLIVFDTQRLAFNHAYAISKAEAEELNASGQKEKYGVPIDKDFASMREVKVVLYDKGNKKILATVTSRKLRRIA